MLKTILLVIVAVVVVVAVAAVIILNQPRFGKYPSGERLQRIEQSEFYQDGKLENEVPTVTMTNNDGFFTAIWKFLFGTQKSKRLIPKEGEIPVIKSDVKHLPADADHYVWFGHSSFLLHLSGKNVLVDPVFISAAPFSFVNRAFKGTDYYQPGMMPDTIDYLVISHDHWDHLDYETVRQLRQQVRHVVCPLGIGEDFAYWGYSDDQIIELDCNQSYTAPDGFVFHCLPTRHFSGRAFSPMRTQRASWVIDSPSRRVFYTGDGGYSNRFERYGQQFPNIDLAIMENGQYDLGWNQIHTLPEQLGAEVSALHPKRFLTVHHSKYALANHAWDEPRQNEQKAAQESGIPLIVAQIGEIVEL